MGALTNLAELAQLNAVNNFEEDIPPEYKDVDDGAFDNTKSEAADDTHRIDSSGQHDDLSSMADVGNAVEEITQDNEDQDNQEKGFEPFPDSVEQLMSDYSENAQSLISDNDNNGSEFVKDADFDNFSGSDHQQDFGNSDGQDLYDRDTDGLTYTCPESTYDEHKLHDEFSDTNTISEEEEFLNTILQTLAEDNDLNLNNNHDQADEEDEVDEVDESNQAETVKKNDKVNSFLNDVHSFHNTIEPLIKSPENIDHKVEQVDESRHSKILNVVNDLTANNSEPQVTKNSDNPTSDRSSTESSKEASLEKQTVVEPSLNVSQDTESIIDRRLLAKTYMRSVVNQFFLHKRSGSNLCEVNSNDGCLDISLRNNVSIKDFYKSYSVESDSPEESAIAAVKAAKMKGWKSIKINGEPEYVEAMVTACKGAGIGVKLNRDYSNIAALRQAARKDKSDPETDAVNEFVGKHSGEPEQPNVKPAAPEKDAGKVSSDLPKNDNPNVSNVEPEHELELSLKPSLF
ncbi:hypothetical protein HNW13_017600 [Shewanella sp. BF02_Schw]|uniref:LPD7 domain-containing protein n=1 Tax=Shewanella sp. BF02_Schw TaxID=394908 RepID=UPI0017818000|nr:LPD7 domain-containing protein [Shewanella sp. BF02_Schw]MBO1897555.1 hypothetical protein [Shewanella sp. BF02_Schw]